MNHSTIERIVILKNGGIVSGPKESPIWNTVNVHDIESLEYRVKKEYEPHFDFRPNPNFYKPKI